MEDTKYYNHEGPGLSIEATFNRDGRLYSEPETGYWEVEDVEVEGVVTLCYWGDGVEHVIEIEVPCHHHWMYEWLEELGIDPFEAEWEFDR